MQSLGQHFQTSLHEAYSRVNVLSIAGELCMSLVAVKRCCFYNKQRNKQASKNNDGRASKVILCPVAEFHYHAIKPKKKNYSKHKVQNLEFKIQEVKFANSLSKIQVSAIIHNYARYSEKVSSTQIYRAFWVSL